MKNRNKTMTEFLTYSGVIAAIYVALTLLFEAISFGLSSSGSRNFCVCFVLYSAAIPGLFMGCLLSNILAGAHITMLYLAVWLPSWARWDLMPSAVINRWWPYRLFWPIR